MYPQGDGRASSALGGFSDSPPTLIKCPSRHAGCIWDTQVSLCGALFSRCCHLFMCLSAPHHQCSHRLGIIPSSSLYPQHPATELGKITAQWLLCWLHSTCLAKKEGQTQRAEAVGLLYVPREKDVRVRVKTDLSCSGLLTNGISGDDYLLCKTSLQNL